MSSYPGQYSIIRCRCCSLELRYPVDAACFKCAICETVTEIIPLPPRMDTNEEPLSLSYVKSKLTNSMEVENVELERKFSSISLLNKSFQSDESKIKNDFRLDFEEAINALDIIAKNNPVLMESLMKCFDNITLQPGRPSATCNDAKYLFIILAAPYFTTSAKGYATNYQFTFARIQGTIAYLPPDIHHQFIQLLQSLPLDLFIKRVDAINSFITFRISKLNNPTSRSYAMDWAIIAASRVMSLFFAASRKIGLPVSHFYNSMVDFVDLWQDFELWEKRQSGFAFCQYPFLMSLGSKINIMNLDAKRQMTTKAREAFVASIVMSVPTAPFLHLLIRRDRIIEDSLNQLQRLKHDIKKKLRIQFVNEDGVDAGGLTKEWFILLVRDLFDPKYGMFTWDPETNYCWFNPYSFENIHQYYLVGMIIGLAAYNATILDIPFPSVCYKKLLGVPVDKEDLRAFKPIVVSSLDTLIGYEGDDFEDVFCLDFTITMERYGENLIEELIPNGKNITVNKNNREQYVTAYVDYLLNKSIANQFEPFRKGFYEVCGGNAFSLFQPDELELLVRGSPEALDITQLKMITIYEGFTPNDQIIIDFWDIISNYDISMQRKFLAFLTGTDRIPSTGLTNMTVKLLNGGNDFNRLPIAHTCFNQLTLFGYLTKIDMQKKLTTAITESEGFGLK